MKNDKSPSDAISSFKYESAFHFRFRMWFDWLMKHVVGVGGISIIIAILLIFVYLLSVVMPIFQSASIEREGGYAVPGNPAVPTLYLAMEEQAEVGLRLAADGELTFFDTLTGAVRQQQMLPVPAGVNITSFSNSDPARATFAVGLSDGRALVVQHHYKVTYPNDQRVITPELLYPMGEAPVVIDTEGRPITRLAVQEGTDGVSLAGSTADRRLVLASFVAERSFLSDEVSYLRSESVLPPPTEEITHLLLDKDQRELYVASRGGRISFYDVQNPAHPELMQHLSVTEQGSEITTLTSLAGGISVLIGTERGRLMQWSLVRDDSGREQLVKIRSFDEHKAPIRHIAPEFKRKGFLAIDDAGTLGIYHATAHRTLLRGDLDAKQGSVAISPRAKAMFALGADGQLQFYRIHNEHPEISWSSLWGEVWYESYDAPQYQWQSSSASDDFEPKFSLVPITFGTIKAAFYAMLVAVPLAIMGAIFTAQFMSPGMRKVVKPSVEIMEALPTVILGFLAGLWLAPFAEDNLPGIFSLLILLPFGILLAAYLWQRLPDAIRYRVPEGWEAALLIPVVILIGWGCFAVSPLVEVLFFGGNMPEWLSTELGIGYDQRNALVVGLAMGFAVIPTIFSIAEDALFAVPKHLVHGSLALGATSWQTLTKVVILTASPGIFSAVMIGLGRAVGETMIVLMATGNTPVMDFSVFQGMRTLSANVAVEMPESEVDSTHYRVLFLAALVLFVFTFFFNTIAEIVRQRLRRKYSSL